MRAAVLLALVARAAANGSSCGTEPAKVPDCDHPDLGSCGTACCSLFVGVAAEPGAVYASLRSYLSGGGADGSFSYVNASDAAGHDPSDDLRPYKIPSGWQYILQGRHRTTGGYVDTINVAITSAHAGASDRCTVRAFSISDIHGALGDAGQNYKTLSVLMRHVGAPSDEPLHGAIEHGCGTGRPQSGR